MEYSGGSVKHHQMAVTAWPKHRASTDHGRCELRLIRSMCPLELLAPEGYLDDARVVDYFTTLYVLPVGVSV